MKTKEYEELERQYRELLRDRDYYWTKYIRHSDNGNAKLTWHYFDLVSKTCEQIEEILDRMMAAK